MEPNFCMENGLKTMETMDSMINIGGYGIWEWGINLRLKNDEIHTDQIDSDLRCPRCRDDHGNVGSESLLSGKILY